MHLQTQNVFDLAKHKRNSSHGLRDNVKQGGRANVLGPWCMSQDWFPLGYI